MQQAGAPRLSPRHGRKFKGRHGRGLDPQQTPGQDKIEEKGFKRWDLSLNVITKHIEVNGTDFRLTLTDQVINQVNNLKKLYSQAYEDPESFEQVSAEISSTINEIAASVDPAAADGDLDGVIQEIIKVVDRKAAEIEHQMSGKSSGVRTGRKKSKK